MDLKVGVSMSSGVSLSSLSLTMSEMASSRAARSRLSRVEALLSTEVLLSNKSEELATSLYLGSLRILSTSEPDAEGVPLAGLDSPTAWLDGKESSVEMFMTESSCPSSA